MKKRIVSLALAVVLIFALVAACSEASDEVQIAEPTIVVTPEQESTHEPSSPESEPTPEPEPQQRDWRTAEFNPVTGWDMMEKLGAGITLSSTTMTWFPPYHVSHETGWYVRDESLKYGTYEYWNGIELIEQWHLQTIADKGFQSILLEVEWDFYMDENYVIEEVWLNRIQQITDWALDAGLNVVFTGHAAFNDVGLRNKISAAVFDDSKYESAQKLQCAIWSQVAEHFKDYPENVLFSLLAETNLDSHFHDDELQYGTLGYEFFTFSKYSEFASRWCDVINQLNDDALTAIRATGGNNDKRVVMLGTPGGYASAIDRMIPPDDEYIMYGIATGGYTESQWNAITDKINEGVGITFTEIPIYMGHWNLPAGTSDLNLLYYLLNTDFERDFDVTIPSFYINDCIDMEGNIGGYVDIFDLRTGDWKNEYVLNAYLAYYGIEPGPCGVEVPVGEFPYEWVEPTRHEPANEFLFFPPMSVKKYMGQMVVELSGDIGNYEFVQLTKQQPSYTPYKVSRSFRAGDERIVEGEGIIIFNMVGLGAHNFGFRVQNIGDADKVERIYIDNDPMPLIYTGPWDELVRDEDGKEYSAAFWLTNTENTDGDRFIILSDNIRVGESIHVSETIDNQYLPAAQPNCLKLNFSSRHGDVYGVDGYAAYEVTVSNAAFTKNGISIADVSHLNRTQIVWHSNEWDFAGDFGGGVVALPDATELAGAELSMDILIHEVRVSVP